MSAIRIGRRFIKRSGSGVIASILLGGFSLLIVTGCQNPYLIRKSYQTSVAGTASYPPFDRVAETNVSRTGTGTTPSDQRIERGQIDYSDDTFVYQGGGATSSKSGTVYSGSYRASEPASSGNGNLSSAPSGPKRSSVYSRYNETEENVSTNAPETTSPLISPSDPTPTASETTTGTTAPTEEEFSLFGPASDPLESPSSPVATSPLPEPSPTPSVDSLEEIFSLDTPKSPSSASPASPTAIAAVPRQTSSSAPTPRSTPSSTGKPSALDNAEPVDPPSENDFPEFARNAYESLEIPEGESAPVIEMGGTTVPRERESITTKEKAEEDLKKDYQEWLARQKSDRKEMEKTPRYLQPLSDDREVFSDPNSPFARHLQAESEKEHQFIREITAADLNMMSDVSSTRELMEWEKEQDMPVDWSKYSATSLYNKWRDFLGMGPNEKEALAIMKKGTLAQMEYEKTKDRKKLQEAAGLYAKAAKKWPDSILEEDALFYAAECYFFDRNYAKAKTYYKALIKKFSNSILRQDAMDRLYYIGVYWVHCAEEDPEIIGRFEGKERPRFSDFAGAKDAFETIFTNDISDHGRAPDALFALANAYMRRGVDQGDASFESAAKYYQRLYEFYPGCKYADKAYQLTMLALYQSYRGPLYDSTPLKKAEEIAKIAEKAKKGDPEVIAEQLRLIREEEARYLLVRGEYYEKKKLYASARNYYNQLVRDYPESEYAVAAAGRYNEIRTNPAEEDQFALVRPVLPFLPKSKNDYYEDYPDKRIQEVVAEQDPEYLKEKNLIRPDFTALDNSKETGDGKEDSGGKLK